MPQRRPFCFDGVQGAERVKALILDGYESASASLVPRFEGISPDALYAPVRDFLPKNPSRIIDLGAGTGRDAAWFAGRGHHVVAVEPVNAFRTAGRALHCCPRIEWADDSLPLLERVLARGEVFDFVLLSGVWQHLDDGQRQAALPRIRTLTASGGCVVVSVRHGPGAAARPVFAARPADAIAWAVRQGFRFVFETSADSVQSRNRAHGVTWTWLVFRTP